MPYEKLSHGRIKRDTAHKHNALAWGKREIARRADRLAVAALHAAVHFLFHGGVELDVLDVRIGVIVQDDARVHRVAGIAGPLEFLHNRVELVAILAAYIRRHGAAGAGVNSGVICHRLALQLNLDGILCSMWVLSAGVNLKLHTLLATKSGLRKHALDCVLNNTLWVLLHLFLEGSDLQATKVAGVTPILLVISLNTSKDDLVCIDDDNKVTSISVWGVLWLVLTTKNHGSLCSQIDKPERRLR